MILYEILVFTANFNPKHVILSFITKFCYRVNLQALHKPYVLIKLRIKGFKSNALDFSPSCIK